MQQLDLIPVTHEYRLPTEFTPTPPPYFQVDRIILTRGSLDTPERERYVRRLCAAYPGAPVEERLDKSHNQLDLGETSPIQRHIRGKHTLVFGVMQTAVRLSEEAGNSCPNYWHFSVYGGCPYGCTYCYLAGTQGIWFSPTVRIYVNLPEILEEMGRIADKAGKEMSFYHGKLQDGLALDSLTAYSTVMMPYFAEHPYARQILLTKSASVERLLALPHRGRTTLSWSLNPPAIADAFEENVPPVSARIDAMAQCAAAGYPVRAMIMPIIPVSDWKAQYTEFIAQLVTRIPLERITFGGVCNFKQATRLMEHKIGRENTISQCMTAPSESGDGRKRYPPDLCVDLYDTMIGVARAIRPDLEVALCLEETGVWEKIHRRFPLGRCNCIS